jgi:hypothetical protein
MLKGFNCMNHRNLFLHRTSHYGANHADSDMSRRKFLIGGAASVVAAATLPMTTLAAESEPARPGDNQNKKKEKNHEHDNNKGRNANLLQRLGRWPAHRL